MHKNILICGASGFIGQEITRLAVALDQDPIGLDRRGCPSHKEPWTHGVRWLHTDAQDLPNQAHTLPPLDAIIIALPQDLPDHLHAINATIKLIHAHPTIQKVAYLSWLDGPLKPALATEAEALIRGLNVPWAILHAGLAFDEAHLSLQRALSQHPELAHLDPDQQAAQTQPTRMEHIAMATFRASLEPQTHGLIPPARVAYLGDAMMLQ